MDLNAALGLIAECPDFPQPGVLFRDLNPVFADAAAFAAVTDAVAETVDPGVDTLLAVEARGFILAAAVARIRGLGVAVVRKPGKLPSVAARRTYQLEYGTATLELPVGVLARGSRAAVVDDVLATGGTVRACRELAADAGAEVTGVHVVVELAALGARASLDGLPVHALRTV